MDSIRHVSGNQCRLRRGCGSKFSTSCAGNKSKFVFKYMFSHCRKQIKAIMLDRINEIYDIC